MPNQSESRMSPRLFALMRRQDGYKKLFQTGEIGGFEFFFLWDPFEHVGFPELSPPHPDEVEFQKVFSARLDLFFAEEAPGLSAERVQERLDELVKEELVKKHGVAEPWAMLRKSKALPKG